MSALHDLVQEVVGQEVTRVCFDYHTRLLTKDWEFAVAGPAVWTAGTGADPVLFEGDEARSLSYQLVGLHKVIITSVEIDLPRSRFVLGFEGGRSLEALRHDDYEAWKLTGPLGILVVAMMDDKGAAYWGPDSE